MLPHGLVWSPTLPSILQLLFQLPVSQQPLPAKPVVCTASNLTKGLQGTLSNSLGLPLQPIPCSSESQSINSNCFHTPSLSTAPFPWRVHRHLRRRHRPYAMVYKGPPDRRQRCPWSNHLIPSPPRFTAAYGNRQLRHGWSRNPLILLLKSLK